MFNEEDGLDAFFRCVEQVLEGISISYEIVCVNDGSRDGTLAGLLRHRERNPRIVVVDLSRNFGKDVALTAAIDNCQGRAVIPMDADLQDSPSAIPEMIAKWREGYDVVMAIRSTRDDPFLKRLTARMFYAVINKVSSVRITPNAGDFRLMDRKVVDTVCSLREGNRFMRGILSWGGFRQTSVYFSREARVLGKTKFNYRKMMAYALDAMFSFSNLPLRMWSYVGAGISFVSLAYAAYLVVRTLVTGRDVPGYPSLMVSILFMGGVQLISLGVIGEYIGRIYNETKHRPLYVARNIYRDHE